ncbi:MAG TPA: flagellar hook-basal body complex protein FliE [Phenylobacterium sp.]|jgi:flagellar hook-basal body complex protein FliE|uniref:Flagellar hook-basal body complex protein FliE n=1 Tax=Phenylobacterium conjunctum TaxID=1298959 RepID=A0ABW3T799_9CAUL|nr:flagellar hook-basal body complex protein FliE [Phenylobacterium sp.]HQN50696.1 flagellar hook-basal body complex protein FliE [Phenylobacterium sp.]HQP19555.1 flagellar hook-basal body complex protein FliE [Phenylobacterium sp.]
MMTALAAAKAYAATSKHGVSAPMGQEEGGLDFGAMVKNAMTDAMQASKKAEHQMMLQSQGKAELIDVVTAISAAETSLETVMAVRDQVISAYQEIMRMPI